MAIVAAMPMARVTCSSAAPERAWISLNQVPQGPTASRSAPAGPSCSRVMMASGVRSKVPMAVARMPPMMKPARF